MGQFVGLDVSVAETSICIVDEHGKIARERRVPTEPEAIIEALNGSGQVCERIGLEAGPLSQWLYGELAEAGLPVICIETRHIRAVLEAQQVNKTDRNDARGIAQMMRVGLFRPVHVKTLQSQQRRMLLTTRKLLQSKMLDLENDLRGTLKNFGFKVGKIGAASFGARVRELVDGYPTLRAMVIPVLVARAALREQFKVLHALLLRLVRHDRARRLLMTAPGVGPVAAMTFRATVDVPARFRKSKAIGAHFGLTPRKHQSGEMDRTGRISKRGDRMVRTALFEAAQAVMIRLTRWCALKARGTRLAKRVGINKARVAVAHKLAVIVHRIWLDGTSFRWSDRQEAAVVA
jgi:transposase